MAVPAAAHRAARPRRGHPPHEATRAVEGPRGAGARHPALSLTRHLGGLPVRHAGTTRRDLKGTVGFKPCLFYCWLRYRSRGVASER